MAFWIVFIDKVLYNIANDSKHFSFCILFFVRFSFCFSYCGFTYAVGVVVVVVAGLSPVIIFAVAK